MVKGTSISIADLKLIGSSCSELIGPRQCGSIIHKVPDANQQHQLEFNEIYPFLFYGQNCHRMDERSPLSEPFHKGNVLSSCLIQVKPNQCSTHLPRQYYKQLTDQFVGVVWLRGNVQNLICPCCLKKDQSFQYFILGLWGGEGQDMGLWWTNKYRIALP